MSQLKITNAGASYKDQVFAGQEVQNITHFLFANVPGLLATDPIDLDQPVPTANVVHSAPAGRVSRLNDNAVVMSATLGYGIGDFDYNWYGVVATKADGSEVLIAVVHTILQTKIQTLGAVVGNYSVKSIVWRTNAIAQSLNISLSTLPWQVSDNTFVTIEDFNEALANKLDKTAASVDSLKLENSSKAQVIASARSGLAADNHGHAAGDVGAYLKSETYTKAQVDDLRDSAINYILGAPPETMQTIDLISQAIGDDPNFSVTMLTAIGLKLNRDETAANSKLLENYGSDAFGKLAIAQTWAETQTFTKEIITPMLSNIQTDNLYTCGNEKGMSAHYVRPLASGLPTGAADGNVTTLSYSNTYKSQMYTDFRGNGFFMRYQADGVWRAWERIYTEKYKPTAADVGAAPAGKYMVVGVNIAADVNLDGYRTTGLYLQGSSANAASGANYPTSNAGLLTVTQVGSMTYQTYRNYVGNAFYYRSYYNGTWYSWKRVYDSGNKPTAEDVGAAYLVGDIYTTTVSEDPSTRLGYGTWAAFGQGRVLVGAGQGQDSITALKTFVAGAIGGIYNKYLTVFNLPPHTHSIPSRDNSSGGSGYVEDASSSGTVRSTNTGSTGNGQPFSLEQPYIVVYMWKRTA